VLPDGTICIDIKAEPVEQPAIEPEVKVVL
jgi:hypothetical protein